MTRFLTFALPLLVTVGIVGCSSTSRPQEVPSLSSSAADTLPLDKRASEPIKIADMPIGSKFYTSGYCVDETFHVRLSPELRISDDDPPPNVERRTDGFYFIPQRQYSPTGYCNWPIIAKIVK